MYSELFPKKAIRVLEESGDLGDGWTQGVGHPYCLAVTVPGSWQPEAAKAWFASVGQKVLQMHKDRTEWQLPRSTRIEVRLYEKAREVSCRTVTIDELSRSIRLWAEVTPEDDDGAAAGMKYLGGRWRGEALVGALEEWRVLGGIHTLRLDLGHPSLSPYYQVTRAPVKEGR